MVPKQVNYLRHAAHRMWGSFCIFTERQSCNPRLLWDWIRELNTDRMADAHQHYCDGLIDPLKCSAARFRENLHDNEAEPGIVL